MISDFIIDSTQDPKLRGNMIIKSARDGTLSLNEIVASKLITDSEEYVRSSVAHALANFSDRCVYDLLLTMLEDSGSYVRCDTILAMGETGDSRVSFPLINYFNYLEHEEQKRVMMAFTLLKDPRTMSFLLEHFDDSDGIGTLAADAYSESAFNNNFLYTFAGSEEMWHDSLKKEARILLHSPDTLDRVYPLIKEYGLHKPQTYVVDRRGIWIGGLLGEHVDVARGRKILSAGEIIFEKKVHQWDVAYLNNRSNGYYPDPSSFRHVKRALESAGLESSDDKFSENFPIHGFNDPEFLQFHKFYAGLNNKK